MASSDVVGFVVRVLGGAINYGPAEEVQARNMAGFLMQLNVGHTLDRIHADGSKKTLEWFEPGTESTPRAGIQEVA